MLHILLPSNQLGQSRAKAWALRKLTTVGEACRAVLGEPLPSTIAGRSSRPLNIPTTLTISPRGYISPEFAKVPLLFTTALPPVENQHKPTNRGLLPSPAELPRRAVVVHNLAGL
jgi:hypothetical protein